MSVVCWGFVSVEKHQCISSCGEVILPLGWHFSLMIQYFLIADKVHTILELTDKFVSCFWANYTCKLMANCLYSGLVLLYRLERDWFIHWIWEKAVESYFQSTKPRTHAVGLRVDTLVTFDHLIDPCPCISCFTETPVVAPASNSSPSWSDKCSQYLAFKSIVTNLSCIVQLDIPYHNIFCYS